jgi:hypothetical protein
MKQPENEAAPMPSSITPASGDTDYSIIRAPDSRALTPLSDCSESEADIHSSSATAVHPKTTAPTIPPNAVVRPNKRTHADTTAADQNETDGNTGAVQAKRSKPVNRGRAKATGAAPVRRSERGARGEVQAAAA